MGTDAPAVLRKDRELGPVDDLHGRTAEERQLRQRLIEPPDLDRAAVARSAVAGVLQVEAELEDVVSKPAILRDAQRLHELDAVNLALLDR